MKRRLHNEHMARPSQQLSDFAEENNFVWNLVNDIEEKDEVYRFGESYAADITSMQCDALLKSRTCDFHSQPIQHSGLDICCNNLPVFADQVRHRYREETRAATDVQSSHALADMWLQYLVRVLKPFAPDVVQPSRSLYWTDSPVFSVQVRFTLSPAAGTGRKL